MAEPNKVIALEFTDFQIGDENYRESGGNDCTYSYLQVNLKFVPLDSNLNTEKF